MNSFTVLDYWRQARIRGGNWFFHAQIFLSERCTLPPFRAQISRGKDRILNENGLFSTSFLAKNEIVDFWGGLRGLGFKRYFSVGSSLGGLSLKAVEEIFSSVFGEEKYGD